MVQGAVKILLRMTKGDEYGVYRVNEDKYRYLILSFDTRKEAVRFGEMTASFLHVKITNHLPADVLGKGLSTVSEKEAPKLKIKKVRGMLELGKKLLYENKTDEEILAAIAQNYLAVGRDQKYADECAEWYLCEAKKAIS